MFKSISATNFYSWKNLDFSFSKGITLLVGNNLDDQTSEGAGKTSVCEALVWCLYGQSTRDVNIDDVIKTGEKDCCVVVTLEDGKQIVRSRKPNMLCIEVDDGDDRIPLQGRDVKETQKMINELIGMSFETFCQSVYFAQNYPKKFITANQEDKGKILSELQDLSVFDRAHKKATDRLRDAKTELSKLETAKANKLNIKDLVNAEFNTFCKLSDTYDADKLAKLDVIIANGHKIALEIKACEEELTKLPPLSNDLNQYTEESNRVLSVLNQVRQQLYHIKMLKAAKVESINKGTCSTCGQSVQTCTDDILIPDATELLKQEAALASQYNTIQSDLQSFLLYTDKRSKLEERIKYLHQTCQAHGIQVTEIEESHNPYLDRISDLQAKGQYLDQEVAKLINLLTIKQKEITYLEFLRPGFKEIKSHVFQSLLAELNGKTNQYLQELFEVPANITFDNISEEGEISKIKTTVNLDGNERSLGLLSGGQFRRVQLAVDFALSDIVSGRAKCPINLRILDESFKDLSEATMERMVKILKSMRGSTILIEHNSIIKGIVDNVFEIELKNGTSSHKS